MGRALAARTRADLAALTADIPAGLNIAEPPREVAKTPDRPPPPAKYVARHAATAPPKTPAARVGGAVVAVGVAAKLAFILMPATSIPPLFLLLVAGTVAAVIIAVAWIRT